MELKKLKTLAIFLFIGASLPIMAQDSLSTHITYDLTTEASVGTGDFTAYQLSTNRPTCAEQLILNIL